MLRNIHTFNDAITDTFAMMQLSTRQKLVGSASVVGNIITNDYDLNELFKSNGNMDKILLKIWKMFCKKFNNIYKTTDVWIVDFKCGEQNGNPIRWNRTNLLEGSTASGIKFVDCILQPNTVCKLDIVQYLNGNFSEISEMYYFDINNKTNTNPNDLELSGIIHNLEKDRLELLADGNLFKAMKREYRILDLLHKKPNRIAKLDQIFNGELGLLYHCISDLNTVIIIKEQNFRDVSDMIFHRVQQTIKDNIGRVVETYNWNVLNDPRASVCDIQKLVDTLNKYLNKQLKKL